MGIVPTERRLQRFVQVVERDVGRHFERAGDLWRDIAQRHGDFDDLHSLPPLSGRSVIPWQEGVDIRLFVALSDGGDGRDLLAQSTVLTLQGCC